VLEVRDGYGRVSGYLADPDHPGRMIADWVGMKDLDTVEPAKRRAKQDDAPVAQYLLHSDNYGKYKLAFIKGSQKLIADGTCTPADFKAHPDDWLQDATGPENTPVYFTFCGGSAKANIVKMNVRTGAVYR
jgi:hypothetical protein